MNKQKHTPEPWGEMGKNVECLAINPPRARISWKDWLHARRCVNALAGYNPEAVRDVLKAAADIWDEHAFAEAHYRLGTRLCDALANLEQKP